MLKGCHQPTIRGGNSGRLQSSVRVLVLPNSAFNYCWGGVGFLLKSVEFSLVMHSLTPACIHASACCRQVKNYDRISDKSRSVKYEPREYRAGK